MITISHPERVMDRHSGLTKGDLALYAATIAKVMLPYLVRRPLMLLRCPGGTDDSAFQQPRRQPGKRPSCFVQKHSGQGLGRANLGHALIGEEEVLYVTKEAQVVMLAQNNAVEVHGWGCTLPRADRPDWIVLDLDPDEALPFSRVVDAALEMREALLTLSLESWVKTTGGKGLHVVVPIARRYDWDTVRNASEQIALLMARAAPDRYVATMSKKQRVGRIFVDFFRNGEGATAVLPYSARARPGLPVALPVEWNELRDVDPRAITVANAARRVARRRRDPWEGLRTCRQRLPAALVEAARKAPPPARLDWARGRRRET